MGTEFGGRCFCITCRQNITSVSTTVPRNFLSTKTNFHSWALSSKSTFPRERFDVRSAKYADWGAGRRGGTDEGKKWNETPEVRRAEWNFRRKGSGLGFRRGRSAPPLVGSGGH